VSDLPERRRRFAEEYARLGVGVAAAKAAGYAGNDTVLGITASRLLKDARVQQAIIKAGESTRSAKVMDRREREELLTAFARGLEDCEPKDRLKAIELLGKMGGDFIEKREVSGPGGGPQRVVMTVEQAQAGARDASIPGEGES
jgi:phage terminase small subunit